MYTNEFAYNACRYALDTAALLGGNEYLVSQMLEKLSQTPYTPEERSALVWVSRRLSPDDHERNKILAEREEVHQGVLTGFFTEFHQERLPRESLGPNEHFLFQSL